MTSLVWISGASAGIGAALAATVPFPDARVVDLSRSGGAAEHFRADLSDPADWVRVEEHFEAELAGFAGERVVFVHNAGTVVPIGPADSVDAGAYARAVLLNSAAPQVLGGAFLRATAGLTCEKHLVMLSSGAATTAYPGWSAYNAGKAAVDHWVRTIGAEQPPLGSVGCRVIAVAPGVVDTAMQGEIRAVDELAFPAVERFRELKDSGSLISPEQAAQGIWSLFEREFPNGSVLDLRKLP
ncbi:SDR family NAD(P)-dependent oxidoreductase [Kribbella qitaiheensis]|uniref:SDR family NAD(P)-dependent oxidoreductase n=1 Tax=Kribbella qitaiheensis TaxID=1544730 RepID=UPI001629A43A|nr:SDR family NAD(P)-dependent oxidoreductase [Kribbella qitaiheensis]